MQSLKPESQSKNQKSLFLSLPLPEASRPIKVELGER
jgi:hypothetical protein